MNKKSTLFLLIGAVLISAAKAETLTPAVDRVSGKAFSSHANGSPNQLLTGGQIEEGNVLTTDANSSVLFAPFGAGIVSLRDNATCTPIKLWMEKNGAEVAKREAFFNLDKGGMFSALETFAPEKTAFGIHTPCGTVTARSMDKEGKGISWLTSVSDHSTHIVVLSGNVSFEAQNGQSYYLRSGSVLDQSCKEDNPQISVVNLIEKTAFKINPDGTTAGERPATSTEMHIAATAFEQTYNVSRSTFVIAIPDGLIGSGVLSEIHNHLSQVNGSLVAIGLPEISIAGDVLPILSYAERTLNPANTNGPVVSPEQ